MDPEAGNVVISYLYFPAGKSRVLVEVHFVIGTILSGGGRQKCEYQGGRRGTLGGGDPERRGRRTYHFERSEGQEGVAALTVGPRVPARVLTLLQDELLTCEATLAVANPAEAGEGGRGQRILVVYGQNRSQRALYSRSRLDDDGADLLQTLLRHVFTV